MKLWERVLERRLRNKRTSSEQLYVSMPGIGTKEALFASDGDEQRRSEGATLCVLWT